MITLYSTEGCHLCEMAYDLCQQAKVSQDVEIVDIAFDDELFSRYGVTIPVLNINGEELNWPFDLQELQHWLEQNGITYHK
ncbi:glutaredoxin family protein [Vibrio sp. Isolate25]|uniref:glutaredoxin family protein n=1 Tax=Vibrio TaxID=662 RepID=UPI001EFC5B57|nr:MULTISPECIES: glutaredoxin family protein [Vibrio]MCG9597431.1 glutaredoxin family protein [Vibrio sp. Isolate25]MCG9678992.1 glutaredoxin family protein [Vibrio sp. Isolate24]USD33928.1 glutaredoxin family protein [Vibrio sp. SCSIO 43186]USD47030.1 glutaredoxin family protein [Vibrio sp. SCSIO 43145]USD71052.1 glutaredoxin family protein [Vibrio sp. SCSIO 43139]